MDDRVKTSFIPKASLNVERKKTTSSGVTLGLFNIIGTVILVAAIVAAVGVFLFEQFTIQSIQNKKVSLERARAAFQPATIKELSRLDKRLQVGSGLLSLHIAPSKLFDVVERETLSTVRFKDFSYSEAGPGRVVITMAGEAKSFNAVALQSDQFGSSDVFSEVIFSNLNIDSGGKIIFDFSALVNTSELSYSEVTSVPLEDAPAEEEEVDNNSNQPQL